MQIGSNTSFSQIQQHQSFQTGLTKTGGTFVRFQEGKGLYTSQTGSTAKLQLKRTGKFSFGLDRQAIRDRLVSRDTKRRDGAQTIKASIDREYGKGMGDLVFNKVSSQTGRNLNQGVTRADLGRIGQALQAGSRAATAIQDPSLGKIARTGADYQSTVRFFGSHFEALTHPNFWRDNQALANTDNFGAGLAFAMLERVTANNGITQQDIHNFNLALDPESIPSGNVRQRLPTTLAGPLNDQAKTAIARQLYSVYGASNGDHNINIGFSQRGDLDRVMNDPSSTGDQKLDALRTAMGLATAGNAFVPENLTGPLSKVPI